MVAVVINLALAVISETETLQTINLFKKIKKMIKNRKHHWANLCTKANSHETKANCHHPIWLDCNCQSHLPPAIVKKCWCSRCLVRMCSVPYFIFFPRCFECQVVGVDLMVLLSVDWIYPEFSGSRFNPQPAGTTRYRWATAKGFYAAIGWAFHHLSFVNSTLRFIRWATPTLC